MLLILSLFLFVRSGVSAKQPHIILFLADDLGWNDVGFHGLNQIPTPNIDALAYSGTILQKYYVLPLCTPSRAALMTGKYPIHTGMQHDTLYGAEARGLPLSETILPQYLKELGYNTHLIGKWNLGSYMKKYLPMSRGFDSHIGFWTGRIDMYDHTAMEIETWGTDFRRGMEVAHDLFGEYATDVYTKEAIKVVNAHDQNNPLFLMVAHSAVHSGNPYDPIRAPDELVANFTNIKDFRRQKFAGVLSKLDESVGKVIESLQAKGLLENSIVIFSTDNGGVPAEYEDNAGSNFPLRGVKNTLWEGGVRGAGLLWSPLLEKKSQVATQNMHIVDWLPTLYGAAGGNVSALKAIDGIDQWEVLSKGLQTKRTSIVHNIDDIWGSAAITVDQWKLMKGTNYDGEFDYWYGPEGSEENYNIDLLYKQEAGRALQKLGLMPTKESITKLRQAATVRCNNNSTFTPCNALKAPCLFNIDEDPCELNNLAEREPDILSSLLEELQRVNKTAVPPTNQLLHPQGDPKLWNRVFTNFGDFAISHAAATCWLYSCISYLIYYVILTITIFLIQSHN